MDEISSIDRAGAWIRGLVVVTFDIELGQAIESVYPDTLSLSENEKADICYLAFPDSNSGINGDNQFHFRIRSTADHVSDSRGSSKILREYNRNVPSSILVDPVYTFGFVYFRQTKDSSLKRGYYQKSLILLTRLPLVLFFGSVTGVIAKGFFEHGVSVLESTLREIKTWPCPYPGKKLSLTLNENVFSLFLPSRSSRSVEIGTESVSVLSNDPGRILPSTDSEENLCSVLLPVLEHVGALWELVLTCRPLVVMASTPSLSSAAVQFLTSVIYPLGYAGDYRPFYTIHDSNFKEITGSNSNALPHVLLGVTNPFFSKALSHWPHILKLGDGSRSSIKGSGSSPPKRMSKFKMDSAPGFYSVTKSFLEKDKNIIKQILKGLSVKRPLQAQSAYLRRHFLELTQTFMIPLERYMASLMPLARNISPYRAAPRVKPFNADDLIKSLELNGPRLTSTIKGDWEGLYRQFLKSPNFVGWYEARSEEVCKKLESLHLQSLSESKIQHWIAGKEEVQLVDMVLRIRKKLKSESLVLPDIVREKLSEHVETILKSLPEDLKCVLLEPSIEETENNR